MSLRRISILMSLLVSAPLMAFAGPGSGNGGDVVRLDIISVRNLIYSNCDHWETLKKASVDCTTLRAKMDEVGTTDHLKIEDEVTLGDDIPRSGRNDPSIPEITFSRKFWLASSADTPAKIGIETHEFLGLLGVEKTDDYHISNALVNEIRAVTLVGDGNKDFLSTMLSATQILQKAENCKVALANDQRWALFTQAFDMLNKRMNASGTSAQEKAALKQKRDEAQDGMGDIALANDNDKFSYCH